MSCSNHHDLVSRKRWERVRHSKALGYALPLCIGWLCFAFEGGVTTCVALAAPVESSSNASSAPPLALQVIRGGEFDLFANYVLVMGESEAILIDTPFTQTQSRRLVEDIRALGRELTHILLSHAHPDHYLYSRASISGCSRTP